MHSQISCTPRLEAQIAGEKSSKGGFTRYNFVACDMVKTSLQHELFRVNQTYNMVTVVVYVMKNVVGFWNLFSNSITIVATGNFISWKLCTIFSITQAECVL